ncbi:MAG: DUF116 domain-containing protein [Endomicrobium sp.]|jgi:hypothetical protein|nr:DUF116 domain-containing protein [Endomicrobium sp.]
MKLCKLANKSKEQSYVVFTTKQNKLQEKRFASVSPKKRIVFAPHCMRNTSICSAIEKDSYYICADCGGCKITQINKLVKKLNYMALYIVKGGRAISKIVKEQSPEGIVGIACFFEGDQAFKMLKEENLAVQFVSLTKDGCSATDANLIEVERVLSLGC